jgi:DNA (cytosine-5)-methyltransferase 1
MKIGSLFSGYGGLDLAVTNLTGAEVAWHCEWEAAPSQILEAHFPGVPNYRDVSKVDFTQVEPVDILTGGFPCQDLSLAGKRAGLEEGTRSGLWSEFYRAIQEIKPKLVIIENVRGLLSAKANNGMEYTDEVLGTFNGKPAIRALGAVLGDLADIGYDAKWAGVRASDAGAPHQRFRVFITAYPSGGGQSLPTPTVSDQYTSNLSSTQQKLGSMHSVTLAQVFHKTELFEVPDSALLRSPTASQGEGGALGEAEARKRGNTVGIRDQAMDLAKLQGYKVSREADNLFPTPNTMDSLPARSGEARERNLHRGGSKSRRTSSGNLREDVVYLLPKTELLPTPNTMEHREIKTPEQIAALKAKSPGGYRNLRETVVNELFPTPKALDGVKGNLKTSQERLDSGHQVDLPNIAIDLLGTPRANAANSSAKQVNQGAPKARLEDQVLLPTPTVAQGRNETSGRQEGSKHHSGTTLNDVVYKTAWGKFEPAIRRWESVIDRPAPEPTKPDGKDGNHRLSSKFTEWMMGLPDGWITDIGLKRNDELKACGNGVVPQQAELALSLLGIKEILERS